MWAFCGVTGLVCSAARQHEGHSDDGEPGGCGEGRWPRLRDVTWGVLLSPQCYEGTPPRDSLRSVAVDVLLAVLAVSRTARQLALKGGPPRPAQVGAGALLVPSRAEWTLGVKGMLSGSPENTYTCITSKIKRLYV